MSKLSEVLECCEGSERHEVSVFRKVLELLEVHFVNVRCCGVSECLDLSECLDVSGCRKILECCEVSKCLEVSEGLEVFE